MHWPECISLNIDSSFASLQSSLMALTSGTHLGAYEIVAAIGSGGMGDVYKARDTRLNRIVAIKVLSAEATADPDRKQRFVREAKAASALNHPNIITVYEIGSHDNVDFIAMEYIAGQTLQAMLHGKGMPVKEVLRCMDAVAGALATAHAAGIVHRDLKPANVMITVDGRVKVLDFGLAKLMHSSESDESASTETLASLTQQGSIVGTAEYMSPEQAQGKKVDHRSDVFSFGVLLYEVITGRRAFQGDTQLSVLASILHSEPRPVREFATNTPRGLEKIIVRCLRKDPGSRFQMMEDVRIALEDSGEDVETGPAIPTQRNRWPLAIAATLILGLALLAAEWWLRQSGTFETAFENGPVLRQLTSDSGLSSDPAISPDGKLLAYCSDRGGKGNLDIWVQQIAGGEPVRLTKDEADDREPSFSPDGSKIVFRSERDGGGVYILPALGGEARRVADQGRRPRFSPNGKDIAYWVGPDIGQLTHIAGSTKIYILRLDGGVPTQVGKELVNARWPVWTPDGKQLLFFGVSSAESDAEDSFDWWLTGRDGTPPIRTGAYKALGRYGLTASPGPFYVPASFSSEGNRVLFSARRGDSTNLWDVPISDNGQVTQKPRRLTGGTGQEVYPSRAGGRMVFATASDNVDIWSLPMDGNAGKQRAAMQRLTQDAAYDIYPGLDAGGKMMSFLSHRSGSAEVWLKDLKTGRETPVADQVIPNNIVSVTPSGLAVSYAAQVNGQRVISRIPVRLDDQEAIRSGTPTTVCSDCLPAWDFSSDLKLMLFSRARDKEMHVLNTSTGVTAAVLKSSNIMAVARFSPDAGWIAFHVRAGPLASVVVVPFRERSPPRDDEWIAITDGLHQDGFPRWSPDGHLLYFFSNRDGSYCLWAQPLHPATKRPTSSAFAAAHFHDVRRSLSSVPVPWFGMAVAHDRILLGLSERTGNIWMAEREGQ